MAKKRDSIFAPLPRPVYDLPEPNVRLPNSGGLDWLTLVTRKGQRRVAVLKGDDPDQPYGDWLNADLLDAMLGRDPQLLALMAKIMKQNAGKPIKPGGQREAAVVKMLQKHVKRVFETVYLVKLVEEFSEVLPLVTKYVFAKEAARVNSAELFEAWGR